MRRLKMKARIAKLIVKIRRFPIRVIMRIFSMEIRRSIVADRVNIWNKLLKYSSIHTVQDGSKTATLITFGAPRLESIILGDLGKDFIPNPENPELPPPSGPIIRADGVWVYE